MSNSLPGLGNYFSFIVIHPVDNNEVKKLLPKGLELAPLPPEVASIIPEGTHPLLFTLGHQKDVRPRFLGLFKLSYLEMSMNVPFVLQSNKKESGPYFFPAHIALTKTFPLVLGLFYGLPKRHADIGMDNSNEFPVDSAPYVNNAYIANHRLHGDVLLSSSFLPTGPPRSAPGDPAFEKLLPMFLGQPCISKFLFGSFLHFEFEWDLNTAKIQPIEAEIKLYSPHFPGGLAEFTPIKTPGLSEGHPLGTFYIETRWTMGLPSFRASRGARVTPASLEPATTTAVGEGP